MQYTHHSILTNNLKIINLKVFSIKNKKKRKIQKLIARIQIKSINGIKIMARHKEIKNFRILIILSLDIKYQDKEILK